jgi:putative transposase
MADPSPAGHDYLRRLPAEFYRGRAAVHWSMTLEDRKTGWLIPIFYYKFRELLTHAAFRYSFYCPIYCLMPDHIHMLWLGLSDHADQLLAARYLRAQLNRVLEKLGAQLQLQGYDHVLREDERQGEAFEAVVEYIARNPERAGLVPVDGFRTYQYTGCLIPGYPDLSPWRPGYWPLFWRLVNQFGKSGLFVSVESP